MVVLVAVRSKVDHHVGTPPEHCPPDVQSLDLGVVAIIVIVVVGGCGHHCHHVVMGLGQDVGILGLHVLADLCRHVFHQLEQRLPGDTER